LVFNIENRCWLLLLDGEVQGNGPLFWLIELHGSSSAGFLSQFDKQVPVFLDELATCVCGGWGGGVHACVPETVFTRMQDEVFSFNVVLRQMREQRMSKVT
jgi:hypothetical protein